uniref:Putative mitochondrial protein n=1 Tax=Tanacetum cinerariifolium TaxID=118510 RepID=A0A6L2M4E6_TANCI|nr:putative mitochondrial protein [Tanacetum cinerariifolium]
MGLTLYLGIERGNITCHNSEARIETLLQEGRLASRVFRDVAFWRSQVNFRQPNPTTDEKALRYYRFNASAKSTAIGFVYLCSTTRFNKTPARFASQ